MAHSQGGAIFAEAVSYNGGDLSKNSVAFHSGANNEWVTNYILDKANINEQYQQQKTTYWNSPIDFVPNVIGFNGNPLEMLGSTLAIPLLFSDDPTKSPHTLPHKTALPSSVSQGVTP